MMNICFQFAFIAMALGFPLTSPDANVVSPPEEPAMEADDYVSLLLSEPDEDVVVLTPDNPWEFRLDFATILQVEDHYVMYYRAIHKKHKPWMTICIATSEDGLHWTRPELDVVNFKGVDGKNNIISEQWNGVGFEYRDGTYYLLADRLIAPDGETVDKTMHFYTSTDGIHFTEDTSVSIPFFCDSQNQILWDPYAKKYRFYLRSWERNTSVLRKNLHSNNFYRMVSYCETGQNLRLGLSHAAKPLFLAGRDQSPAISTELPVIIKNESQEDFDIYYAAVHQYLPDLFIAYPCNYYFTPDTGHGGELDNDGYATIGFWVSSNGKDFTEIKRDYITNGGNWLESTIGHIETDDCLIHYYIPFENTHVGKHQNNCIRARIHYKNRAEQ